MTKLSELEMNVTFPLSFSTYNGVEHDGSLKYLVHYQLQISLHHH